jgi:hypothetical protein
MQGWAKLTGVDDTAVKEAFYGLWKLALPCQFEQQVQAFGLDTLLG